jgi:negative regulator of flagellin synthesis FlgM
MNISQDMQPVRPIAQDIQVALSGKVSNGSASEQTPAGGDQAHLSGAASLASHAASLPDVRQEKVAAVQAAIASGTYSVSSQVVAQSMIDHMLGKQS